MSYVAEADIPGQGDRYSADGPLKLALVRVPFRPLTNTDLSGGQGDLQTTEYQRERREKKCGIV